jgi:hypothetical protein
MNIFLSLSTFVLRQVIDGVCEAVGFKGGGEVTDRVVGFLTERFAAFVATGMAISSGVLSSLGKDCDRR